VNKAAGPPAFKSCLCATHTTKHTHTQPNTHTGPGPGPSPESSPGTSGAIPAAAGHAAAPWQAAPGGLEATEGETIYVFN